MSLDLETAAQIAAFAVAFWALYAVVIRGWD